MSDSELQTRLGKMVGGDADETELARMWAGVGVRRAALARRAIAVRTFGVVLAAAAVVLGVLFGRGAASAGPLATRDGNPVRAWSVPTHATPLRVELDDGSAITLAAGSRLEPVENAGGRFCVLLRDGSAHFSVRPGGPRRWVIEAGVATVEVVGTVFDVTRDASGVRVSVERGVVVVRGERVPNRVRRLEVHESIWVPDVGAKTETGATPATSASGAASASGTSIAAPTVASAGAPPSPSARSLDALLDDADRARREGRTQDALALLARVSSSHDDARAALASFTRAKLELDDPARLADATSDLEHAIARGLPAPLDEEARARLVDAYERAGRHVDARRAALAYLSAHPDGRVAAQMHARATAP